MKSAILLSLASSSLAVPFGNVVNAVFGTSLEVRQDRRPGNSPSLSSIAGASGSGFPFPQPTGGFPQPTGGFPSGFPSGFPQPTGSFPGGSSGGRPSGRPSGRPGGGHHRKSKTLAMDYQLAPTAVPEQKLKKEAVAQSDLPSFSLLNPSDASGDAPTSTPSAEQSDSPSFPAPTPSPEESGTPNPGSPFPTGGFPIPSGGFPFPTGGFPFPTGGFPGTGAPSLPSTLATMTRGPRPTGQPSAPGSTGGDDYEEESSQSLWDWIKDTLGNGAGGKSEMSS